MKSSIWWRWGVFGGAFLVALMSVSAHAEYGEGDNPTPTAALGAEVYMQSCVLCHGREGDGEAPMPLGIDDYPETDLMKAEHAETLEEIREVISHGGVREDISNYMPPFGKELTWTELHSVTLFVEKLRRESSEALALLEQTKAAIEPSVRVGHEIYASRCVLCHGRFGEGDGRMARVLTSPAPADLTTSEMPDEFLELIINKGGEEIGRSKHMPPWGDQLSEKEIRALIMYINSIRDS